MVDPNASVLELESKMSARPDTGKVIDTVSTKPPHQVGVCVCVCV